MNSVMQGLLAAANQDPRLTRVFSTYTASNPSIYLDIDREKAQALGLSMNDVFGALQATLGGIYINNFNLFGRVWQVNIEGEAADRREISSLWQIYIRNKFGTDVPLRSIATAKRHRRTAGHHPLQQLPGDPDPGQPGAGHLLGHRAGSDGAALGQDAPARAMAMNGPEPPTRSSRPPGRPGRSSDLPCCSRFCSSWGSMKAG